MSLADQRYKYYDKWTVEELKQVNKIHRVGQLQLVDGQLRLVNGWLGQVGLHLIGERTTACNAGLTGWPGLSMEWKSNETDCCCARTELSKWVWWMCMTWKMDKNWAAVVIQEILYGQAFTWNSWAPMCSTDRNPHHHEIVLVTLEWFMRVGIEVSRGARSDHLRQVGNHELGFHGAWRSN